MYNLIWKEEQMIVLESHNVIKTVTVCCLLLEINGDSHLKGISQDKRNQRSCNDQRDTIISDNGRKHVQAIYGGYSFYPGIFQNETGHINERGGA